MTDAQRRELAAYTTGVYAELSRMMVAQLRAYAREHYVPMGGESTKAGLVQEMVGQLRHRRLMEMEAGA